jgi:hypothetical protein
MKMTVYELMRTLSDMDPDAEVRIATQPNYPLTHSIGDVVEYEGAVYLAEGGDGQYGSREIFQ